MRASAALTLAFFLLAAVAAGGCANTTTTTVETSSLVDKKHRGAHARLKFQRPDAYMASGMLARVSVGEQRVASIANGGSAFVDVPAGSHTVVVDAASASGSYTVTVNAKPGTLYTLEIAPRVEPVVAVAAFGLVGMMVESAVNQNGGSFQVSVVGEKPLGKQ